ncbi:hypothetical protein L202_06963 [Cryptococcus amylolentus CBS 6039]|uniref:SWIM-type domain-containing protein n=2 Tax=Cryptococcus amylolentus TaxID=104669 RepID=A0A1E3HE42_9TREE|nr:hypothetical protein L202_06963 [Cryptococcus amylolentus CBS 6039]ODN74607.1 hypothetical protein L202_06963 [Cryptococcus amylolentus CBS 6039]
MMERPPQEFLYLAATLLDALPASEPISDALLLQLHMLFGPMLMSALQLVDRREVVRVEYPSSRHVYQVASSTGKSYTLYIDPPSPTVPGTRESSLELAAPKDDPPVHSSMPEESHEEPPLAPNDRVTSAASVEDTLKEEAEAGRRDRIRQLAVDLEGYYCPCAGYGHNTLGSGRTVVCKHLLAVLIGSKTGRVVASAAQ